MMRFAEKSLLLQILDQSWKDHLLHLDQLRQCIGLRAYGQRGPLNEYKREAFELFEEMLERVRETVTTVLCHVEMRVETAEADLAPQEQTEMRALHEDPALATGTDGAAVAAPARAVSPEARTRLGAANLDRSEEHTSELQALMRISHADYCLKKKTRKTKCSTHTQ